MNRMQEKFKTEISNNLQKKLGLSNQMMVPKLDKIIVSICTSDAIQNPKVLNVIVDEVAAITGQKPVITKAKKAISNFKLRAGLSIGVKVTLRRDRMWVFFDKLVWLA